MESVIFPQVSYFSLAVNWRQNTVSHLLFCSISAGYAANFSYFFSSSLISLVIQCFEVIISAAKDHLKFGFAINKYLHKKHSFLRGQADSVLIKSISALGYQYKSGQALQQLKV